MNTQTRTDERTELDQRTKDELAPQCDHHTFGQRCEETAAWVRHQRCPGCGLRCRLACDEHATVGAVWCLPCGARGTDVLQELLSVEPLR